MKTIFLSHGLNDQKAREISWALREKCERLGFQLVQPSEMSLEIGSDIITSIFERIKKASLVIAVMSERSSYVLLELGYALGMGKAVILVADLNTSLPFDLSLIQAVDSRSHSEDIAMKLVRAIEKLQSEDRLNETDLPYDLTDMLRLRTEYPEKFEQISGLSFERAVRNAFQRRGYHAHDINPSEDFGFDFRVFKDSKSALVEVKKNSPNGKVSIAPVQQLLGAVHAYDTRKALLICTSNFTDSARGFASRYASELTLWTLADLEKFTVGEIDI
jgi:HJR/Mrr/RecB family endonuclease